MKMKTKSRFFNNILLTGISLGLYGLTKIGFNVIVLKYYDSETVGIYNLAISASLLIGILVSNLFYFSISKFTSEALGKEDHDEFWFFTNLNFWVLLLTSILFATIFYLLSPWIVKQFGGNIALYRWSAFLIILNSLYNYFKNFSYVIDKIGRYTILEIVSSILFFTTLVVCLLNDLKDQLLLPMFIQMGLFCFYSIFANLKYLSILKWLQFYKRFKNRIRDFIKYSLITGLGTTFSMWLTHIFTLLLGRYADARIVGYFSVINSAVDPLNFIPRVLNMVSFPRISYLYGKKDYLELYQFIKRNYKRILVLSTLLCVILLLVSSVLIEILFNTYISENDVLLKMMIIARCFGIIAVFHIGFLSGTKYPLIPNLTGPIALVLSIPLLPLFYNELGIIGIGVVVLFSALLKGIVPIIYGEKILRKSI